MQKVVGYFVKKPDVPDWLCPGEEEEEGISL